MLISLMMLNIKVVKFQTATFFTVKVKAKVVILTLVQLTYHR